MPLQWTASATHTQQYFKASLEALSGAPGLMKVYLPTKKKSLAGESTNGSATFLKTDLVSLNSSELKNGQQLEQKANRLEY